MPELESLFFVLILLARRVRSAFWGDHGWD
jgi:hypothetical protein